MDDSQGSQMGDGQEVLQMLLSQARKDTRARVPCNNCGTSVRVINEYFYTVCPLLSLAEILRDLWEFDLE